MLGNPGQIWTHRHLGKDDPRCGAWVTACIGWCWPDQRGWEAEWPDARRGDNKLRFGLVDFKVFGDIHLEKNHEATLFQTPMGTCLECGFQAWKRSQLDMQCISFDPVMPLSEIWNSEILVLVQNVLCVRKLTVALFAQAKILKQHKGPPIRNWLNLLWRAMWNVWMYWGISLCTDLENVSDIFLSEKSK